MNGGAGLASLRRRSRLPGPFDVPRSGVDPIQEIEHFLPHLLRRRAVVLGQPRLEEQVARAGVTVRLEGGPGSSDGLAYGYNFLLDLHPGVICGVVYLYRHPFGPAIYAEVVLERPLQGRRRP